MALAALIVSAFTLIIAGVSTAYFRQQALAALNASQAAAKTVAIEEDRRREEQRPRMTGEIEELSKWHRLRLRLDSPWSLTGLEATIVEGEGVEFTPSQDGVLASAPKPIRAASHGTLQSGDATAWRVSIPESDRPEHVRLQVKCSGSQDEEWTVSVTVKVPHEPLRVRTHIAHFLDDDKRPVGDPNVFVNVVNATDRALTITHVWFAIDPPYHVLNPLRPLEKVIRPDEVWETWAPVGEITSTGGVGEDEMLRSARVRLATGRVVEALPNQNVPSMGMVPGR